MRKRIVYVYTNIPVLPTVYSSFLMLQYSPSFFYYLLFAWKTLFSQFLRVILLVTDIFILLCLRMSLLLLHLWIILVNIEFIVVSFFSAEFEKHCLTSFGLQGFWWETHSHLNSPTSIHCLSLFKSFFLRGCHHV